MELYNFKKLLAKLDTDWMVYEYLRKEFTSASASHILSTQMSDIELIFIGLSVSISAMLLIIRYMKGRKKTFLMFSIFMFFFALGLVSVIGVLCLYSFTLLCLITATLLIFLLVYGPIGIRDYFVFEKEPRPWWVRRK